MKENLTKPKPWSFVIDLNERGVFRCHIENSNSRIVFSANNEESEDGTFWLIEDGFMRNIKDMEGLEKYLKCIGVMPQSIPEITYVG